MNIISTEVRNSLISLIIQLGNVSLVFFNLKIILAFLFIKKIIITFLKFNSETQNQFSSHIIPNQKKVKSQRYFESRGLKA